MRASQRRAHAVIWLLVAPLGIAAIVVGRATAPARPEPVDIPAVEAGATEEGSPTPLPTPTSPEQTRGPSTAP